MEGDCDEGRAITRLIAVEDAAEVSLTPRWFPGTAMITRYRTRSGQPPENFREA